MQYIPHLSNRQDVQTVYQSLMIAYNRLAQVLRNSDGGGNQTTNQNQFGDIQLDSDIQCESIINQELSKSNVVKYVLSEETPQPILMNENGSLIITFDPLDGSSIIGCNWTVGTIVGIWEYDESILIGKKGKDLIASSCCMYGSRTSALFYNDIKNCVQELSNQIDGSWTVTRSDIKIKKKANTFSPGNLRSVSENENYKQLVDFWISSGYTLRYTGGMVPDIYQIFIKEQGIFSNMISTKNPAKLRYLYEVAPMAYLVEKANGQSTDGFQSILDIVVYDYVQRSAIAVGSEDEIQRIIQIFKK